MRIKMKCVHEEIGTKSYDKSHAERILTLQASRGRMDFSIVSKNYEFKNGEIRKKRSTRPPGKQDN